MPDDLNIYDISEERKKKKEKNRKSDDNIDRGKNQSRAEHLSMLAWSFHPMNLKPNINPLRTMLCGKDFRILHRDDHSRDFIEISENDVVRLVKRIEVVSVAYSFLEAMKICDITKRDVDEFVTRGICCADAYELFASEGKLEPFSSRIPYIIYEKEISLFKFKSDPGYTWNRADFDPDPSCHPGLWKDVEDRTTNFNALLAWLWSVTVMESNREQYIYMQGEGSTGKSRIVYAIQKAFGSAAISERCPNKDDDRFFISGLENKRFVSITEANEKFVQSNLFKSLTGDDIHKVEKKRIDSYSSHIKCKFLLTSNEIPEIPALEEHHRRIILCEVGPITGEKRRQDDVDKDLAAGLPWLFWRAYEEFEKVKHLAAIPCDRTVIEEYSGRIGEAEKLIFSRFFVSDPSGWVSASDIYRKLETLGKKTYEIRKIIKVWMTAGIVKISRRGHDSERGYEGLRIIDSIPEERTYGSKSWYT